MNIRKLDVGNQNMVGQRVVQKRAETGMLQKDLLAKLQTHEIEISIPALSLLEGQKRSVSDFELNALADIFNVTTDWLLERE